MDDFSIFILLFLGISIGGHLIDSYLKIKMERLKQKGNLIASETKVNSIQNQIEYLMTENEEMKEELRNINDLLSRTTNQERIDLDYEKRTDTLRQ